MDFLEFIGRIALTAFIGYTVYIDIIVTINLVNREKLNRLLENLERRLERLEKKKKWIFNFQCGFR